MVFEHVDVFNFENAIRGMRNPKDSWDKSDSYYKYSFTGNTIEVEGETVKEYNKEYVIGPNDIRLAQALISGGSVHRKFLRQILVSIDITGSMYWNAEFDTYKVSTVRDSCSKMHKIHSYPITLDCFELDGFEQGGSIEVPDPVDIDNKISLKEYVDNYIIDFCEYLRENYLKSKDKVLWKELIRWLPEGWLQKYTWTGNYEVIRNMVESRYHHKLNEWSGIDNPDLPHFIDMARSLPYAKELIFYDIKV